MKKALLLALLSLPGLVAWIGHQTAAGTAVTYQGFGAATPGGAGGSVFHVTNLNDSGPGSLREAVSQGHRTVVFDVAGEIVVKEKFINVTGAFITIDGSTAPAPGITLRNGGIRIWGKKQAHDVIVRGLRIRNAASDGIQISWGAYNVVIDHVSIRGSGDGNIDITYGARDVTVSWSILADPLSGKNMLIKYSPARVTLHHNLLMKSRSRNPQVSFDESGMQASDTTLDMRNNLVWDWGAGYGTLLRYGPQANIVNNFYSSPSGGSQDRRQAVIVCKGDGKETPASLALCGRGDRASHAKGYVAGNFSADGLDWNINAAGNRNNPFGAPSVDTQDACTAAHEVVSGAGVRPLDQVDQRNVTLISLPPCASSQAYICLR